MPHVCWPRPELGPNRFEVISTCCLPESLPRIEASKGVLIQGVGIFPRSACRPLTAAELRTYMAVGERTEAQKSAEADPNDCLSSVFDFKNVVKSVKPEGGADGDGREENDCLSPCFPFFLGRAER